MKIQLLKRRVKLRIDRHIIVIPRENAQLPTRVSGWALKVKNFASFLRKYEVRLQKNKCKL